MGMHKFLLPDIGNYENIPVIELLVSEGDTVEKDQSVLTLESDKATMEIPAPVSGVIRNLQVKLEDKVSKGSYICDIETSMDAPAPAPAPQPAAAAPAAEAPKPAAAAPAAASPGQQRRPRSLGLRQGPPQHPATRRPRCP